MFSRFISASLCFFGSPIALANAQGATSDLDIIMDGCAVNGNRVTVQFLLKNNSSSKLYLAQINDGQESRGSSSAGGYLYIIDMAGMTSCHGDTRACQNGETIRNVDELSYIEANSTLSSSATYVDGLHSRLDPTDTTNISATFMVRKGSAAGQAPGRPYAVRSHFARIQFSQCR